MIILGRWDRQWRRQLKKHLCSWEKNASKNFRLVRDSNPWYRCSALSPHVRVIWIPESGKFFPLVNPGHWALESRTDSVLGIRNPTNDWDPETKTTYDKGSGIHSVRSGIHSEEFRIHNFPRLPDIITYQPIGAGHAWRWINEDMYTPLAHLPRHNAPYLPPKLKSCISRCFQFLLRRL